MLLRATARPRPATWAAALALLLGASACAVPGAGRSAPRAAARPPEEPSGEASVRGEQTLNLYLGGALQADEREGYTFGGEYEYRLNEAFGVGAFAESVAKVERVFASGALLYWHPVGDWVLLTGPGYERAEGEWSPILRVGAAYEIELGGGLFLTPELSFDFSEGEDLWVFGFNLGVRL